MKEEEEKSFLFLPSVQKSLAGFQAGSLRIQQLLICSSNVPFIVNKTELVPTFQKFIFLVGKINLGNTQMNKQNSDMFREMQHRK